MRKVLRNHNEVAHVWAQQNQTEGRASNMFFEGPSIYSYGHHFEIARFVTPEIVLFNARRYSNSTSKHQRSVRRAVSHKTTFTVSTMENHNENAAELVRAIKADIEALKRSRTGFQYKVTYITQAILEAEKYARLFKKSLNRKNQNAIKALSGFQKKQISPEWLDQQIIKETLRDRAYAERERVRHEEHRKRVAIEQAENIEKWKNGENVYVSYDWPTLLRVKGDYIETSHGAKVSLIAARKLWRRFLKNTTTPELTGLNLGHYTVSAVEVTDNTTSTETAGVLVVGCHRIPFAELYRMADILGWRNGVPFDALEVLQ